MTKLSTLQRRFLDYLQHADMSIVTDIAAGTDDECQHRLSIYYNAYRIRLRGSIETDHPVLGVYLGDDGFERLATAYIDKHPSAETSLRHFCDSLPEFLRQQSPYSRIAVLAQLATFERLLMDAFDAADATPLTSDFLSSLAPEQWPQLTLRLHPSMRIFTTDWNCIDIWRAIKAKRVPPEPQQDNHRAWLVWRNQERLTEFRSMAVDEHAMLQGVVNGENFAAICTLMLEWTREDAIADRVLSHLRRWIDAGLIVAVNTR